MKKLISGLLLSLLALTSCSDSYVLTGEVVTANAYVKSTVGEIMSGAFMTISNQTDKDMQLVGARSDVAQMVEIHQVVDGVMSKIDGGLTIAAGQSVELQPGGNHVMLMGLTRNIMTGSEVPITLIFSDGTEVDVLAIAKEINVGSETYEPDAGM